MPDPPSTREWGAESRGLARRTRIRRVEVVVASVVVAALAVPVVRSLATDPAPPVVTGTVHGTGPSACRQLDHRDRLGRSVDTRVVDGKTAAAWLRATDHADTASQVAEIRTVTVCVMDRNLHWTVAVARPGRPAVVAHQGDYPSVVDVMSEAGLPCEGRRDNDRSAVPMPDARQRTGSERRELPSVRRHGGTALLRHALLYSPRKILDATELDALLLAVDRAPIRYVAPNVTCSGNGMPTYALVLRYPSGTRTVSMEECRGLALGPYTRNAPTDLDRQFERSLLSRGTVAQNPPTCPLPDANPPLGTGDLRHVVAARYCPPGSSGHALTPAQLRGCSGGAAASSRPAPSPKGAAHRRRPAGRTSPSPTPGATPSG